MIKVTYEIREDETNRVYNTYTKEFKDEKEEMEWMRSQSGHPFLHDHVIAREVVED
jgi:hypothetical protein